MTRPCDPAEELVLDALLRLVEAMQAQGRDQGRWTISLEDGEWEVDVCRVVGEDEDAEAVAPIPTEEAP